MSQTELNSVREYPIRILRSNGVRRLLLILVSILFALGLIEFPALINVFDYRSVLGADFAWWPKYNIKDPELIHIRRPYVHFNGEMRGGGFTARHIIPPADSPYRRFLRRGSDGFLSRIDEFSSGETPRRNRCQPWAIRLRPATRIDCAEALCVAASAADSDLDVFRGY